MAEALIIEPGEDREIEARVHRFSEIHVKSNGFLRIAPESARWSIWWVEGDVVIDGMIVGTSFTRSVTPITDVTPDGKAISHQFLNAAEGGTGGSGGGSGVPGRGTTAGGTGARGTTKYGGGGGSPGGVHIQGASTHLGGPGQNAVDWRGAPPAVDGGYTYRGGDGAQAPRHSNGALLMIRTNATFRSGQFGGINLFGVDGLKGNAGTNGYDSNRGWSASGGGGGGAPGGDGGRLVVVARNFATGVRFSAQPGIGGWGGPAGSPAHGATGGTQGDKGDRGFFDQILMDQWVSGMINIAPGRQGSLG